MTKPNADNPSGQPLGLPLNNQLGPLPERVAAAGCPPPGWVEPGVVPSPVGRRYTQADLDAAVTAERERLANKARTRADHEVAATAHHAGRWHAAMEWHTTRHAAMRDLIADVFKA